MIALISCGKRKSRVRCKARDMYQGTYFRKCLEYAELIASEVYIVSEGPGVTSLDQYLDPYDVTVRDYSKEQLKDWINKVQGQLRARGLMGKTVISLVGNQHKQALTGLHLIEPLKGKGGMGGKMGYMTRYINSKKSEGKGQL